MSLSIKLSTPFKMSFLDYPSNDHCISIYFIGCIGKCKNCQNKQLIDEKYNIWTTIMSMTDVLNKIKYESNRYHTTKITLVGGDPLYYTNIDFTRELLKYTYNKYDVCLYTGRSIKFVKDNNIHSFKFLKTGMYDESLYVDPEKTDDYFQLSSTNQEIYDENFNLLTKRGRLKFK